MKKILIAFVLTSMLFASFAKADAPKKCEDRYEDLKVQNYFGHVSDEIILVFKNHQWNKMQRLIYQAKKHTLEGKNSGIRLLKRLHRQINGKMTLAELSAAIVKGNEDGTLCTHDEKYSDVRDLLNAIAPRGIELEEDNTDHDINAG